MRHIVELCLECFGVVTFVVLVAVIAQAAFVVFNKKKE